MKWIDRASPGHVPAIGLASQDDSANQCTVPDGLSPLMQQLSSDELPLALLDLDTSKPAILFPPAPETAEDTVADVASS